MTIVFVFVFFKVFLITQISILISVLGPGTAWEYLSPQRENAFRYVCQLCGPQNPSTELLMQILPLINLHQPLLVKLCLPGVSL